MHHLASIATSKGTKDCIRQALAAGIPVYLVENGKDKRKGQAAHQRKNGKDRQRIGGSNLLLQGSSTSMWPRLRLGLFTSGKGNGRHSSFGARPP